MNSVNSILFYKPSTSSFTLTSYKEYTHEIIFRNKDLLEISRYEDDWDGYGSLKLSSQLIFNVYAVIERYFYQPSLSVTKRKSILLEYRYASRILAIEIFDDKYGYALIERDFSSTEERSNLRLNFDNIIKTIEEFYGSLQYYNDKSTTFSKLREARL